ncbi:MAG: hypothetical protein KC620_12480, partial [Myxococcales bacterium]|nr:hypothetical protein [Myxococcales bacterium]
MRRLLPFIALLLALAAPAMAAPLDDARLAHQTAEKTLAALDQKRAELDRQHERLAVEIEALKTKNDNPLLPGVRSPRLDARLKDARALAERLGALDREVRDANAQVEQTRESLRDHLDAELAHLRLTLAEADAADRRAIFEAMRALVDERGALAAAAPAPSTVTATLPTPPDDEMASPGELRELADEAGDHAEQVRRQLDTLEERLGALEERRRLVRAALAFQRDDSLFGQDERNRRLARRTEGIGTAAPVAGGQNRGDNAGGGGEVAALDDAPKTPTPAPGEAAESPPQRFAGDENPPAQDNADP